eukprot:9498817-Pyramimonas_sp.AAC.1
MSLVDVFMWQGGKAKPECSTDVKDPRTKYVSAWGSALDDGMEQIFHTVANKKVNSSFIKNRAFGYSQEPPNELLNRTTPQSNEEVRQSQRFLR